MFSVELPDKRCYDCLAVLRNWEGLRHLPGLTWENQLRFHRACFDRILQNTILQPPRRAHFLVRRFCFSNSIYLKNTVHIISIQKSYLLGFVVSTSNAIVLFNRCIFPFPAGSQFLDPFVSSNRVLPLLLKYCSRLWAKCPTHKVKRIWQFSRIFKTVLWCGIVFLGECKDIVQISSSLILL